MFLFGIIAFWQPLVNNAQHDQRGTSPKDNALIAIVLIDVCINPYGIYSEKFTYYIGAFCGFQPLCS
jgi:hypothetical protein